MRNITQVLLLLVLICVTSLAFAGKAARHDRVKARIKQFAQKQGFGNQVHVGSLKALSQMSPCHAPLNMKLYGHGSHRNMRVSCPGQGWQLYVPVQYTGSTKVAVATHDLDASKPLTRSDLKLKKVPTEQDDSGQIAQSLKSVVGKTLTSPVSKGTPIRLSSLNQAVKVHSGQDVSVHVHAGQVSVSTTAIALQQGRVGQSILVKNPKSGKHYRVKVTRHGVVDDLSG